MDHTTQDYLATAVTLAREAGRIMLDGFENSPTTWKADDTPVTQADKDINDLVIKRIAQTYPDHDVKGEEASSMRNDSDHVWVCDPIDGTTPYSHGIPLSMFSLALVKDGTTIVAVCHDPYLDRTYTAIKGRGAKLNDKPLHVNTNTDLHRSILILDGWSKAPFDILPLIDRFTHHRAKVLKLGSIVYAGMLVASGHASVVVFPGTTGHDGAAVKLIVEEAGGRVTDLFGEEQRYDQDIKGYIATNGHLHEHVLRQVKHILECHPRDEHKDHEKEY